MILKGPGRFQFSIVTLMVVRAAGPWGPERGHVGQGGMFGPGESEQLVV